MIVGMIINSVAYLVKFLSLAIPNWFLPVYLTDSIDYFIDNIISLQGIIPIAELLFVINIILYYHIIKFMMSLVLFIIGFIRGIGYDPIK